MEEDNHSMGKVSVVLQSHSFLVSYRKYYIILTINGGLDSLPNYLFNLFLPFWVNFLSIFRSHEHSCITEGRVAEARTLAFYDS